MKKLSILIVVFCILFTGCKKELAGVDQIAPASAEAASQVSAAKEKLVTFIVVQNLVNAENDRAAKGGSERSQSARGIIRNADREAFASVIRRAIDPSDYECGRTVIDDYIDDQISTWDDNDFNIYFFGSWLAFDYAYVYQNSDASGIPYYGDHGQFTNITTRTVRDIKKFWDIPTNIYVTASHGIFYNDIPKMVATLQLYRDVWGLIDPATTDGELTEIAGYIRVVFGSSHFQNFLHPLLTFNAFASPEDPYFGTPKKIVMGDGLQQAFVDLGFGLVGTQGLIAHEYAHQVQFAKPELVMFEFTPEGTRFTELMADALAGYFLTHSRGAALNWHRVQDFQNAFFSIGDCQFGNPNHHGTPAQRMKAAKFGHDLANGASNQGHILSSQQVITRFIAAYPAMIAPDGN